MTGLLIVCRSMTYAQRTKHVLERKGFTATIVRPNLEITGNHCGYAVKISENYLPEAMDALRKNGLNPVKVVISEANGRFRELRV